MYVKLITKANIFSRKNMILYRFLLLLAVITSVKSLICGEGTFENLNVCINCPPGSRSPPGSTNREQCECSFIDTWHNHSNCCKYLHKINTATLSNINGLSLFIPKECRTEPDKNMLKFRTSVQVPLDAKKYEVILKYSTQNSYLSVIEIYMGNGIVIPIIGSNIFSKQDNILNYMAQKHIIVSISKGVHNNNTVEVKYNDYTNHLPGIFVNTNDVDVFKEFSISGDFVVLNSVQFKVNNKLLSFWDFSDVDKACQKCPISQRRKNIFECETCISGIKVQVDQQSEWWKPIDSSLQVYIPDWAVYKNQTNDNAILRYSSVATSAHMISTQPTFIESENIAHICQNFSFKKYVQFNTIQKRTPTPTPTPTTTRTPTTTPTPILLPIPTQTSSSSSALSSSVQQTTPPPISQTPPPSSPTAGCDINKLCGDGILNIEEACDDGNTLSNDGCDEKCFIESAWTCSRLTCMMSICRKKTPTFFVKRVKLITLDGGEISTTKSLLEIPVGSISSPTNFSIQSSLKSECVGVFGLGNNRGTNIISECYTFGPEDTKFNKEIKISINEEILDVSVANRSIHRYDTVLQKWIAFDTVISTVRGLNRYSTLTLHFSTYAVMTVTQKLESTKAPDVITQPPRLEIFVGGFGGFLLIIVCLVLLFRNSPEKTQSVDYNPIQCIQKCQYCINNDFSRN